MLYWVNKLVWGLANAETLLLLALTIGGLLAWRAHGVWRRLGGWLLGGGVAFALAVGALPLDQWVLAPLESRFPPPDPMPAQIDGAVVLGGGITVTTSALTGRAELNEAGDRFVAMIELARRYPEARIVFTSGSRAPGDPDRTEADFAGALARAVGLPAGRVELEREARNTRENARETYRLVRPEPGERWLLVTSATHMPRSIASFRAAGWEVEAYPVDFRRRPGLGHPLVSFADRLDRFDGAFKEWLGLLGYRLLGWTDELFPAPRTAGQ